MSRLFTNIGIALVALLLGVPMALAQESASFHMQQSMGDYATGNAGFSPSFKQSNNGVTWNNSILTGNTFVLTTGPVAAASSAAGGDVSNGGTTGGGSAHTGGGHRSSTSASGGKAASTSSSSSAVHGHTASSEYSSEHPAASSASSTGGSESSATSTSSTSGAFGENAQQTGGVPTISFFGAVDPLCTPTVLHAAAAEEGWSMANLGLLIGGLGAGSLFFKRKRIHKFLRKKKNRAHVYGILVALGLTVLGLSLMSLPMHAHAAKDTTPSAHTYKGNLLNTAGQPITAPVTIRFSYWKSSDYVPSDTTGGGGINTGAANYVNWTEAQTVTPTAQGYFSVELGSVTPLIDLSTLPASTLTNLYLQVEVKMAGAPDTSYELLDTNPSDSALDRSRVTSVPFASNADLLDQHDTGTGSFNIPVLDLGGLLPKSTIPGGTNQNTFILDADDTAANNVVLQFGTTLAKQLTYDKTNGWFNFNDDVHIQGDLTVTGLINGIDVGSLQGSTGALKAFAGAGLSIGVSGGSYRINGTVTNYLGATGVAVPANATSMVFFGSGGLTVSTGGFPTDESYIAVAQVTTSATNVLTVADRRVMSSDDRESTVQTVFNAEYEHASYQGDGSDNVGQLTVSHDNTTKNNFYLWTSSRPTLQDYDILLKAHLSPNFMRWKTGASDNAMSVQYRTTSVSNAANALDIQVYDTNGVPVTLSGSVSSLANTAWSTTQIEMGAGGTWTPGQDFLIRIHAQAKDNFQVHLGALKLQSVELRHE